MPLIFSYTPFDFHAKCHGMKWENLSELVNEVNFDDMAYFWTLQGDEVRDQLGVFRTKSVVLFMNTAYA